MSLANSSNTAKPKLHILSQEQMHQIHNYSIRILENTGIQVEAKTALEIFKKSNAVRVKNNIVHINKELIDYAIKSSPSNIEIFNKEGKLAFNLGAKQADETYFGIGVTNPYFQEIESGDIVPFLRKHMQETTSLGNILENYDMISTLGVPSDGESGKSDLLSSLDMYANTIKPMVLLFSEEGSITDVFDMLTDLHGDISSHPFCIPYVNPITPLILNKSTTDKMIASININLPVMFSNYSMYGGSSPVSEGGTLALLNAELLAGLVFSQLVKEGSEIILGSLPAAFNMRTMGSSYTPTTYLLNLACAEMMSLYDIPHCGTSGSSNGRGPDLQASADLWINHLTSCIGKVGCAPFVGSNFDSLALSPANIVLSDNIIARARKFAKGFDLNEAIVDTDEIEKISHGGNYFTSPATLEYISELDSSKDIWPSESMETWIRKGKIKADKILTDYTMELYKRASAESQENIDIIEKGETFINKIKK